MRRYLALLAGCGFRGPTAQPASGDDAPPPEDGATDVPLDDALVDAMPDAMPDAPSIDAPPVQIMFVQGTQAAGSSQQMVAATFPQPQQAHDLVVLVVATRPGETIATIKDSHNDAFTQIGTSISLTASNIAQSLYYAVDVAAGANTVTVTFGNLAHSEVRIYEYSGIALASPLDGQSSTTGNSSTVAAPGIATTVAHDLLFAGTTVGASISTADNGFMIRGTINGNADMDRVVMMTGTYVPSATQSSPTGFVIQAAAFKGR